MKNIKTKTWLVKAPGQHSKDKWRVVESCGVNVAGPEIFSGICEVLTSRSSDDNFSDATEKARAKFIAQACNEHAALVAVAEAADFTAEATYNDGGNGIDELRVALASLAAVRAGSEVAK